VSEGEHALGGVGADTGRVPVPSLPQRIYQWFWRQQALVEQRRALPKPGDRALDCATRAKQCDSLARVAWTTRDLGGEAVACELFRESAYWALCALNRDQAPAEQSSASSARIWSTLPEGLAVDARWRAHLAQDSFIYFAALPTSEQSRACTQLQALTTALLGRIAEERRGYERVLRQRVSRVGALLLVPCLAVALLYKPKPKDLAEGTAWHLSSAYTGFGGCGSPNQTCAGAHEGWFFHTGETDRNPWIEFELDGNKMVSRVEVENRTGCCPERAVPLAIEVSLDRNSWQRVALRKAPFESWQATFPPVLASWVRLRVRDSGPLHLKRVRIFE
jgi:hypothetical protein